MRKNVIEIKKKTGSRDHEKKYDFTKKKLVIIWKSDAANMQRMNDVKL